MLIKQDAAYVAGVIDSEGTIRLNISNTTRANKPFYKPFYSSVITIANTEPKLLEDILRMIHPFKATINGPYSNGEGNRPIYKLYLESKKKSIAQFIHEIEPYVMLKATQLQLLKEFAEDKAEDPEFIRKMIMKLNKRGAGIQ